jgi:hypothetical protein
MLTTGVPWTYNAGKSRPPHLRQRSPFFLEENEVNLEESLNAFLDKMEVNKRAKPVQDKMTREKAQRLLEDPALDALRFRWYFSGRVNEYTLDEWRREIDKRILEATKYVKT